MEEVRPRHHYEDILGGPGSERVRPLDEALPRGSRRIALASPAGLRRPPILP